MKTIKILLAITLTLAMALTIAPNIRTVKANDEIHIKVGPKIDNIYTSKTVGEKDIKVKTSGRGTYTVGDDPTEYSVNETIVKIFKNGNLYETKTIPVNSEAVFKSVTVSYDKSDSFKVALYMNILGEEKNGPTRSFKLASEKISKVKVKATKISNKKVYLRWGSASGATGFHIYMGKKKVKTVSAKTTKTMVTKKKAGKSKFRVVPYVKVDKKEYKSSSNTVKPKKNEHKWKKKMKVKSYPYATCKYVITKVSLTGKTYTVTGYAMNSREWDFKRYKSLKIDLKVDGKKAFSKKYKNKNIKIKENKKKKIVFKIKGKAGMDLANGKPKFEVTEDPDWGIKNDSFKE
ncbi:MAG: hypothetical protein IJ889_04280 [Eubacterium sp.]|nr:hypothetical protein [Eubacterium sp.]